MNKGATTSQIESHKKKLLSLFTTNNIYKETYILLELKKEKKLDQAQFENRNLHSPKKSVALVKSGRW